MSQTNTWIRIVYLYLFAAVGLIFTVAGTVMLINLGLKIWVFTKADIDRSYYMEEPVPLLLNYDRNLEMVKNLQECSETCNLTEVQKQQIDYWLEDYAKWRENQKKEKKVDYITSQRQRQASSAISMILVGIPLYLYHWAIIKRDHRKKKEKN